MSAPLERLEWATKHLSSITIKAFVRRHMKITSTLFLFFHHREQRAHGIDSEGSMSEERHGQVSEHVSSTQMNSIISVFLLTIPLITRDRICRILWSSDSKQNMHNKFWNYAPIGIRKYINGQGKLVHSVTNELETHRIREIEQKTILKLSDFRQAHCSACPDRTSACSGRYFNAIAPEICRQVVATR
jgi:hypothetical protein